LIAQNDDWDHILMAYLDESLFANKRILLAMNHRDKATKRGSKLLQDNDFVLEMVKVNGYMLRRIYNAFCVDVDIVIEALKSTDDHFLQYVYPSMWSNIDFIVRALQVCNKAKRIIKRIPKPYYQQEKHLIIKTQLLKSKTLVRLNEKYARQWCDTIFK
jgi:hypothetical protein